MRAFYSGDVVDFLQQSSDEILGIMTRNNGYDLTELQKNTWVYEITLFQSILQKQTEGRILFEYTIPRIGKRIDVVLLLQNIVFVIEFKVGEHHYNNYDIEQVLDYALDIKNFHKESHDKLIVPILVCTKAQGTMSSIFMYNDKIIKPLCCNAETLYSAISQIINSYCETEFDYKVWENSVYLPTPTIIEAAQALYAHHNVKDISRSDAGAFNLSITTQKVNDIIEYSKKNNKKSICFVTGVPGAGKTLAGINIANERHQFQQNEHAVFLSGNGPLVEVLQEALARDEKQRNGGSKREALRKVSSFIQIIHHYRDAYVGNDIVPTEKVVIFDEAQRAWTKEQIAKFMAQKKGILGFEYSEPEFLISTMNRHKDWAVIVCLIGGGQEINTGEAGLVEWFESIKRSFSNWEVFVSDKITDLEYIRDNNFDNLIEGLSVHLEEKLHLATSIRSFRSENVSAFVKAVLDNNAAMAREILNTLEKYPIKITRSIENAKKWIKDQARGTERYGLLASSGGLRLKANGIFVKSDLSAPNYFLESKDDVRSSYYLEDCATEFDVQGLELDWSIVAWDGDLRYDGTEWTYNRFMGNKWQIIRNEDNKLYLKNAYRVLLTRARQGMIIFVPESSIVDKTRRSEYYDKTFEFLKQIGIEVI